ncbi:DNA/RNA non-specific endonuclease [Flavobacteriaceae bacterium]|nr:DNA/RNA non-specific endonuclease [Flavobacteriaceae bacterium]
MKNLIFTSIMLFAFINSNSQTLIKNDVYEVMYSETFQQPIKISYEYPELAFAKAYFIESIVVLNEVGYPDPFKEIKEWKVPTNIITSDNDDYTLPYHRGHIVPAKSFEYSEHQKFIYSYLNCAIMHKDLNQGVWYALENRERKLKEKYNVKVQVELFFADTSNTVDAGATIPSSFRKIIEYSKKGKLDLSKKYKITREVYEFPNNGSVKNTDLASYKI